VNRHNVGLPHSANKQRTITNDTHNVGLGCHSSSLASPSAGGGADDSAAAAAALASCSFLYLSSYTTTSDRFNASASRFAHVFTFSTSDGLNCFGWPSVSSTIAPNAGLGVPFGMALGSGAAAPSSPSAGAGGSVHHQHMELPTWTSNRKENATPTDQQGAP
jgi:hypothetical protein